MNARNACLSLFVLALVPMAKGQPSPCPHCKTKDQAISELKAELQALKGTPAAPEAPAPAPAPEPAPAPVEAVTDSGNTYTVEAGDSLIRIAQKTGCKTADLASLNGLKMDSTIRLGQKLKLPASATVATAPSAPETPAAAETPTPANRTYKIKDGDTYYSIAKELKIPMEKLVAANPKIKPSSLYAGRVIQIPADAGTPTNTEATTAGNPPANQSNTTKPEQKIRAVKVEQEISYGDFAKQYGTDIERLNSLNTLNLTSSTILAKGSELYVPAQP